MPPNLPTASRSGWRRRTPTRLEIRVETPLWTLPGLTSPHRATTSERGAPGGGARSWLSGVTTREVRIPTVTGVTASIEVAGARKRFGSALALDGLSFSVSPGDVTGFVGPNGAGKSTTMRAVLGLDALDEGSALISGRPYASLRHPLSHVGSLLDAAALHPARKARDHLFW